jgi:hypothetical protein
MIGGMQMAVNSKEYAAKKAAGKTSLVKIGDDIMLAVDRYNPDNGERLPSNAVKIDPKAIDARIANLQAELDAAKELKADIEALA